MRRVFTAVGRESCVGRWEVLEEIPLAVAHLQSRARIWLLDLLPFDWLGELILLKDRDGEIFPTVEMTVEGTGPFALRDRAASPPRARFRGKR